MKKAILTSASVAALMIAAPAAAQSLITPNGTSGNQSDIYQDGNDNQASVNQGPGVESLAEIDQNGDDNIAIVDQQNSPAGTLGFSVAANEALVQQNGNGNVAVAVQDSQGPNTADNNDASITQYSTGPVGTVGVADALTALGVTPPLTETNAMFTNAAVVRQTSGTSNNATIIQGTSTLGTNGNLAYVEQIGSGHDARIYQYGNNNAALIDESGAALVHTNNDVTITQNGDRNLADVDQEGANLLTTVTQDGDDNEAFVMDQEGSGNGVDILQTGHYNLATVGGSLGDQAGSGNIADIEQGGDYDEATIVQASAGNQSFIKQLDTGWDNEATSIQTTSGNYSLITQGGGTLNTATVEQTVTSGSASYVTQDGNSNTATVNQ